MVIQLSLGPLLLRLKGFYCSISCVKACYQFPMWQQSVVTQGNAVLVMCSSQDQIQKTDSPLWPNASCPTSRPEGPLFTVSTGCRYLYVAKRSNKSHK